MLDYSPHDDRAIAGCTCGALLFVIMALVLCSVVMLIIAIVAAIW